MKKSSASRLQGTILILLALLYAGGAILSAWNIIIHTQASTQAIEQVLKTYNMRNEGEKALESYDKEHPFLGMLFSGPIKKALKLPSHQETVEALSSDVEQLLKTVRRESSVAAWWSWFLLCLSVVYVATVASVERSHATRGVLFSLTLVSLGFFVIGILAPAMVLWTAPIIPLETGNLTFVVQHQVRGIFAIIWELITRGHWLVGGFLFLFSIITPLTKASLTFFVTACPSKDLNYKIGNFLHAIGKWSMADVFVAAILLALYALKFQEATKSIPCLGLYYFIGYCLLSLTTTELLVHSTAVAGNDEKTAGRRFGPGTIVALAAVVACFLAGSSVYTYQQYTENTKESVRASSSPDKLNSTDLVLPVHK
jgi:paraquat-inducible protein A